MRYPEISVIVPCYKEAEVIEANILTLFNYLQSHFDRFEIIVITDGSPDGTQDSIKRLSLATPEIPLIHIPFAKNRGKGAAIRAGVLASRYSVILFLDADLTIPIEEWLC